MQVLIQEFTNYHFDVKPNALHGALDRFAQFFIDPLCKADALEREVMAVDNEFSGMHSTLNFWHPWLPFCTFHLQCILSLLSNPGAHHWLSSSSFHVFCPWGSNILDEHIT